MSPYVAVLSAASLLLGSCAPLPRVDTPAAEAGALSGNSPAMPRLIGDDEITRRTDRQLAAVGADKLDALKPGGHGEMTQMHGASHGGEAHGMGGHGTSTSMPQMDHGAHSASPAFPGGGPSHQQH